jgi:hypothetical protein
MCDYTERERDKAQIEQKAPIDQAEINQEIWYSCIQMPRAREEYFEFVNEMVARN